ncbi:hypothetical protein [Streptomyces ardesiacus]|uniref:hypothetical protein n=1 Tax=Streptomyces ardesiacus TaxID=285564 RepID=UPI003828B7CF
MDPDGPGLSALRHQEPIPVGPETFKALKLSLSFWPTGAERMGAGLMAMTAELRLKMASEALANKLGRRIADYIGFGEMSVG